MFNCWENKKKNSCHIKLKIRYVTFKRKKRKKRKKEDNHIDKLQKDNIVPCFFFFFFFFNSNIVLRGIYESGSQVL